ncbi:DNA polymerase III DnaE [compost metagenome]
MSEDESVESFYDTDEDLNVTEDEEETYQPLPAGRTVITGGVVKQVTEIVVKNGKSTGQVMASVVVEDAYQGDIRCTIFADQYGRCRSLVKAGNVIFINGSIDYYRDSAQINVKSVTEVNRDVANRFNRTVLADDLAKELAEINEDIALIEETMEAIGVDDVDLISDICEQLIALYDRREEITRQREAVVA